LLYNTKKPEERIIVISCPASFISAMLFRRHFYLSLSLVFACLFYSFPAKQTDK